MNGEAPRGRTAVAFLGESKAVYREGEPETDATLEKPATLEEALDDAAGQAFKDGYTDGRVVYIGFKTGNPHIKELNVIVTPGA